MGPKTLAPEGDLFRHPLREQINLKHPLVRLAELIDWDRLSVAMSAGFVSRRGRPATSPRLIAGLLYLQHAFDLSDEDVVWQWEENPYWQVFTGETYLQTEPPIDPSSLTRWRKRLGEAGVEELLAETIEAAKRAKMIKTASLKRVIVDTTVMEKAIAHPTDSRLLERCREQLVKAADRHGLKLRQNYNREAPRLACQIGRYAHAKQYKRMRKALRTLRSRVGRVMRDVERQLGGVAQQGRAALEDLIGRTKRILSQKTKDKNKLYALHAPEVECISKGKARQPYEFGVKVSITTTHREGLVIGARSMPGNPYDGHTLAEALEQAAILSDVSPEIAVVDRGYKGVAVDGVQIYHPGLRRGITRGLRTMIKRRSAIEPAIGHMKADGKLDRNWLKGALGDAIHAVMCGAGHNLRMILRKLRLFYVLILAILRECEMASPAMAWRHR
ncbi:IS5 family transposase [Burkholderia vietnamiensis]|uniref:IS5 family transposase n=1 Tax=Burkholderia vietnamiensis TaxID=60552 RepID=UPI00075A6A01|nr:IS5 family transposase [Burkholderia vietnamiensis]KVR85056.1 transposase [Burkholderia vietnamiensis]KVS35252.1 transposase [Burkholderia vietnamiensis]MBR8203994.1 IS5 family transposase [Burkholderia vietnamiensis]MCA8393854.1 IS5 family transposase [Burkholderia vietnamiensis]HDR8957859.1 IS5 family transposase [Burkholderia vietnamiensis]